MDNFPNACICMLYFYHLKFLQVYSCGPHQLVTLGGWCEIFIGMWASGTSKKVFWSGSVKVILPACPLPPSTRAYNLYTCTYIIYFDTGLILFFLIDNYIDGAAFVGLTVAEIKGIVPPIGLAKKIINLVPKVRGVKPNYYLQYS